MKIRHPIAAEEQGRSFLYKYGTAVLPCAICNKRDPSEPDVVMVLIGDANYHSNCYITRLRKRLEEVSYSIRRRLEKNVGFGIPHDELEWMEHDVEALGDITTEITKFYAFVEYHVSVSNPLCNCLMPAKPTRRYVYGNGFDYNGKIKCLPYFVHFDLEGLESKIVETGSHVDQTGHHHVKKMVELALEYIEKWKGQKCEQGVPHKEAHGTMDQDG